MSPRLHLSILGGIILFGHTSQTYAANSLEYELDPYYSNVGYYISLTDEPTPEVIFDKEDKIHDALLSTVFSPPRLFLIEASVNPLPLAGVYLKRNNPGFYDDAQLTDDFNVIQALTEGFEEPYALSLFLGNVVIFKKPNQARTIKNRGYTGYLLSIGDKHIVNNELVDDNWYEFEFKIKGDRTFEGKSLSWSLRTGVKIHSNSDIADVVYFGVRRNHLDITTEKMDFIDNSDIEYTIQFDKNTFDLIEQEFFISKKWQINYFNGSIFTFGVGFILERDKYRGALAANATDFSFIIRPNLQF